ncbi:MAG TPA: DUF5989 family protein [Pirellulales bacterium]|nr:DUF5989 family protein [Pirellulales bacterium]
MSTVPPENQPPGEFEHAAAEVESTGLVRELFEFFGETKKWWLLPIVVVLLMIGGLLIVGNAAPFLYTLF